MRNRHRRRNRTLGLLAAAVLLAVAVRVGTQAGAPGDGTAADRAREETAEVSAADPSKRRLRGPGDLAEAADSDAPASDEAELATAPKRKAPEDAWAEAPPLAGDAVDSIELDSIAGTRAAQTVSLRGRDPDAPRELLAWRMKHGRFAIVARGHSERGGELVFPEIIAPRDGIEVVVTGADGLPGLPGASEPQRLGARDPAPPHARLLETEAGRVWIRITPTETTGDVVLADSYGGLLARYEVSASPSPADRVFDVPLAATGARSQVMLSHEFPDGRASEWSVLDLSQSGDVVD